MRTKNIDVLFLRMQRDTMTIQNILGVFCINSSSGSFSISLTKVVFYITRILIGWPVILLETYCTSSYDVTLYANNIQYKLIANVTLLLVS